MIRRMVVWAFSSLKDSIVRCYRVGTGSRSGREIYTLEICGHLCNLKLLLFNMKIYPTSTFEHFGSAVRPHYVVIYKY